MLTSLIINGIIGVVAGLIVRGRGAGCVGNVIVGAIGGWLGNFIVRWLGNYGFNATANLAEFLPSQEWVPIVVGFLGSVILLAIVRALFDKSN
jgi:uncharacterized membrane protein YeaQ/YmgE (transglycosylase-associated protein family)